MKAETKLKEIQSEIVAPQIKFLNRKSRNKNILKIKMNRIFNESGSTAQNASAQILTARHKKCQLLDRQKYAVRVLFLNS
jgi:hypothetical protein